MMLQAPLFPESAEGPVPSSAPVEIYEPSPDGRRIDRKVFTRSGDIVLSSTELVRTGAKGAEDDWHAAYDSSWLRADRTPDRSTSRGRLRLADLFSGCGALSLGISEACRALGLDLEHAYAADSNERALNVCRRNFSPFLTTDAPIETLVQAIDAKTSTEERALTKRLGLIDVLAGGPPCQGNSDLNNYTRRKDSRNALFDSVVRFVQLFEPRHVIIENVPGVRHDNGGVTERGRRALELVGYHVFELMLTASDFGVAQRRRRYFMIATRQSAFNISSLSRVPTPRTLHWACGDLVGRKSDQVIDSCAASSAANRDRIQYLFKHDLYDLPDHARPPCHSLKRHSYRAVYGRLRWDEPAQTITSGFNSPGQGRFVHPQLPRTLTPREAARVQFLPDSFDWGDSNRESLTQMIGNAVPPKLAYAIALELLR